MVKDALTGLGGGWNSGSSRKNHPEIDYASPLMQSIIPELDS